jgi:hypothetical protein
MQIMKKLICEGTIRLQLVPPANDDIFYQAEAAFMGATSSGYNEPEKSMEP